MAEKRPNIILVQVDSLDGRAMGCMGHPSLQGVTPNVDSLANKGVMFRNNYCNSPVCCPSRASMWSGQYTHHCEGWNNFKGLSETDPTFKDHLIAAGYRTEIIGSTDYLSGHHSIRARVSPWTRSAKIFRPNYRMPGPNVLESDAKRVHEGDWKLVERATEWIEKESSGDSPFFLYVSLGIPHPPFVTSRYYLDKIDESTVEIPPIETDIHPVHEYQRINKNWRHGFSDETVRLVRRVYYAMIAEMDVLVGELLKAISDAGLDDNTYIIFVSDHGELAMEHQQYYKMSLYEPSVRVPFIVKGPGVEEGKQVETPTSLVDLFPTLMDMAGISRPEGLDGHSLMPELTGKPSNHPNWALSEFHDTTAFTGSFMIRQGDWKYIVYVGCQPQLFNLKDDPWEVNNLSQAMPEKVKEMDNLLRQVVDYEAVDKKVKAYDKASFKAWREERLAAGDYYELMTDIFSGAEAVPEEEIRPWTEKEEGLIRIWLES